MSEHNGTAIAVRQSAPAAVLDGERVETLRRTIARELGPDEFELFVSVCKHTGLDPFARQVYALKVQGRLIVHIGIDGLRLIAERTGRYGGQLGPYWCGGDGKWVDVWTEEGPPHAARVGVIRKDWQAPAWAVARLKSYGRDTPTWRSMPDVMLAKAAEAQALRRAFPQELASVARYEPEYDQGPEEASAEYREINTDSGEITEKTPETMAAVEASIRSGLGIEPENTADAVQEMFDQVASEQATTVRSDPLWRQYQALRQAAIDAGQKPAEMRDDCTESVLKSEIGKLQRALAAQQTAR